jgi:Flavin reductase like domain
MIIDGSTLDPTAAYKLLIGSIVPRAIGWVSTLSTDGVANLAPISFFTAVGRQPPMVSLSMQARSDGHLKDTFVNMRDTGEFCTNLASLPQAHQMHRTAAEFPSDVDEFEAVGLEKAPTGEGTPGRRRADLFRVHRRTDHSDRRPRRSHRVRCCRMIPHPRRPLPRTRSHRYGGPPPGRAAGRGVHARRERVHDPARGERPRGPAGRADAASRRQAHRLLADRHQRVVRLGFRPRSTSLTEPNTQPCQLISVRIQRHHTTAGQYWIEARP